MFMVAVQSLDAFLMFIYVATIKNGTIRKKAFRKEHVTTAAVFPVFFLS